MKSEEEVKLTGGLESNGRGDECQTFFTISSGDSQRLLRATTKDSYARPPKTPMRQLERIGRANSRPEGL